MLSLVKCWEFCSSKGIKELAQSAAIMLAGLRICPKVNGDETYDKQGSSRKVSSDQTTKCTEASQGSGSEQTPGGIAKTYSE